MNTTAGIVISTLEWVATHDRTHSQFFVTRHTNFLDHQQIERCTQSLGYWNGNGHTAAWQRIYNRI